MAVLVYSKIKKIGAETFHMPLPHIHTASSIINNPHQNSTFTNYHPESTVCPGFTLGVYILWVWTPL